MIVLYHLSLAVVEEVEEEVRHSPVLVHHHSQVFLVMVEVQDFPLRFVDLEALVPQSVEQVPPSLELVAVLSSGVEAVELS